MNKSNETTKEQKISWIGEDLCDCAFERADLGIVVSGTQQMGFNFQYQEDILFIACWKKNDGNISWI